MVTLANSQQSSDTASTPAKTAHEQRVNGFPVENKIRDMQFKLAHNLQCSLDLRTTLEMFFSNIQEAVTLSGMTYQTPNNATSYQLGQMRVHTASYSIAANDQHLGKIIFSRAKKFVEVELAALEMLLGVLYYPLKNALLYQQALHNSLRDPLTGIGNKAAWQAAYSREVKLAQRHKLDLSLLVIDIDHFKAVNDSYGHQCGDKFLKHLATGMEHSLRETDQVFRFGGEEFVVLLNNTSLQHAALTAERIRVQVAMSPVRLNETDYCGTISIGVAHLEDSDDADSLFNRADKAMYESKRAGRNKVSCL